jgi:hypothetical protein
MTGRWRASRWVARFRILHSNRSICPQALSQTQGAKNCWIRSARGVMEGMQRGHGHDHNHIRGWALRWRRARALRPPNFFGSHLSESSKSGTLGCVDPRFGRKTSKIGRLRSSVVDACSRSKTWLPASAAEAGVLKLLAQVCSGDVCCRWSCACRFGSVAVSCKLGTRMTTEDGKTASTCRSMTSGGRTFWCAQNLKLLHVESKVLTSLTFHCSVPLPCAFEP